MNSAFADSEFVFNPSLLGNRSNPKPPPKLKLVAALGAYDSSPAVMLLSACVFSVRIDSLEEGGAGLVPPIGSPVPGMPEKPVVGDCGR